MPTPLRLASFVIKADGDISLKADQVKFDGFRVMLQQTSSDFIPRYDVCTQPKGLLVTLEIPTISLKEDGTYDNGEIKYSIVYHESPMYKGSVLKISGEKKPLFILFQDDKPTKINAMEDLAENNIEITQTNSLSRQFGKFSLEILLPQDIVDDMEKAKVIVCDGMFFCFLPKKLKSESGPKPKNKLW